MALSKEETDIEDIIAEVTAQIKKSASFVLLTVDNEGLVNNCSMFGDPEYLDRIVWDFLLRAIPDIYKHKMDNEITKGFDELKEQRQQKVIDAAKTDFERGQFVTVNGRIGICKITDVNHTAKKLRVTSPDDPNIIIPVYMRDVERVSANSPGTLGETNNE